MPLQRLFVGNKVRLTHLSSEDIPTLMPWYQDGEFARLVDASTARLRTQKQWEKWLEESDNPNIFMFAIRTIEDNELIGWIELDGILWNNSSAWLAIGIGNPGYRGRGYGTEAMTLLLDFAFSELNLYRVQLTVFSYNTRAIGVYSRLGFTREGVFREALHRDGQRYDMYLYGLLRHEWEAKR